MKIPNEIIIELAKKENFDLVGFAKAEDLEAEYQRYLEWINKNYGAGMNYMKKNIELRKNPKLLFPECLSVITLGANYFNSNIAYPDNDNFGKISRYAIGIDYHYILWNKCEKLCSYIKSIYPDFSYKYYVDTGPIMEKVWGQKSGIGWIGKNTLLINPKIGSWFFIAIILTNAEFEYSTPMPDHCGTCKRCVEACPTGALSDNRYLNSNKCVSYYTIEYKESNFPDDLNLNFDNWLFGCDICQEVCPFNAKFQTNSTIKEFFNDNLRPAYNLIAILNEWDESYFSKTFSKTPLKRAKLKGIKRNANYLLKKKTELRYGK